MRILFLDQATLTGWAANHHVNEFVSGVQDFSLKRGESPGMRYLRFDCWLRTMISSVYPELICYEQAHNRGGSPTEIAYGLIGQIQRICAELKIEFANVHTSTLKKFWTGSGRADKSDMIRVCIEKGFTPKDNNEADAIAGWHWAQNEYSGAEETNTGSVKRKDSGK